MTDEQFRRVRPAAVAGSFYPSDPNRLNAMIDGMLDYAARTLKRRHIPARVSTGTRASWPKAVIVPHAGYVYSGTTAALAYSLLASGRGTIRRAVIVGPTHRVPVRGVAMSTADAWQTPLGKVAVDVEAERSALDAGRLIVNNPTHAREHAVEVQVPFLQKVLGPEISIVPLNAGDATPREVGDALRALWGGPETVIVISSDLSHYHPERVGRAIDDETIERINALDHPISPDRACGAYPINGLLDVIAGGLLPEDKLLPDDARPDGEGGTIVRNTGDNVGTMDPRCAHIVTSDFHHHHAPSAFRGYLELLGRSTSGDDGEVALAGEDRPAMADPDDRVVGYASWALWEVPDDGATEHAEPAESSQAVQSAAPTQPSQAADRTPDHEGSVLLRLAHTALAEHLGIDVNGPSSEDIIAAHPWLADPGASFVTLTENGRLRGCIGSIIAHQPLGRDIAEHAVDAAVHDPRFWPVGAQEYPLLHVEVSVLSAPEPMRVQSREALEQALRPGIDGLILSDGEGRSATFLPQVWDELPDPHDFVSHLLAKAGLSAGRTWHDGEITARRYTVRAYR